MSENYENENLESVEIEDTDTIVELTEEEMSEIEGGAKVAGIAGVGAWYKVNKRGGTELLAGKSKGYARIRLLKQGAKVKKLSNNLHHFTIGGTTKVYWYVQVEETGLKGYVYFDDLAY